jgi:hypothetical protein
MSFTVNDCTVTRKSITIIFSGPVDQASATTPANYTVFDPGSPDFGEPAALSVVPTLQNDHTIKASFSANEFQPGDWVNIVISGVTDEHGEALEGGPLSIARQVPGGGNAGRIARDVEDAISYPVLTEEIGYRPSPVGIPTGSGSGPGGGGAGMGLGQVAARAVGEVLGWKPNAADPKGFVGALTQAFTLKDVEGHVESTWTPRTYAVQTDLGGGITGAQASLYMRAKNALDSALPLLDGLYPLDPEADPEYVKALREMARSQMTEIVKELGTVGLPSILRIDTYFGILLGQNPAQLPAAGVTFDPDEIAGTLGQLRDTYGIFFEGNQFNNSVEDEQDITNFRVISDYMTSLMQSWIANRQFFFVNPGQQAFFGTQLVLISRQFTTIAETVNEVRFALDSVFIGPSERQTLLLRFEDTSLAPMFLEDVLIEVEKFFGDEASRLLRDGGKISVTNNILPVVRSLQNMVEEAHVPANIDELPDGFKTARVRNALDDLQDQLQALVELIEQVEQETPPSEDKLTISGILLADQTEDDRATISIFGDAFDPASLVSIKSPVVLQGQDLTVEFFSAQRLDVTFDPGALGAPGSHDVAVTNPDGQSTTLFNAFSVDSAGTVALARRAAPASTRASAASRAGQAAEKTRKVTVDTGRVVRSVTPSSGPATARGSGANTSAVKAHLDRLEKGHNELAHKLEGMLEKMSEFFEGKGKDHKSKHKND